MVMQQVSSRLAKLHRNIQQGRVNDEVPRTHLSQTNSLLFPSLAPWVCTLRLFDPNPSSSSGHHRIIKMSAVWPVSRGNLFEQTRDDDKLT